MAERTSTEAPAASIPVVPLPSSGRPLDRRDKALFYLDRSGRGLEIGPSYSPLLPKESGARIETVDHAPRDVLVAKYRSYGVPEEKVRLIEEVDHIWDGGSLVDSVGGGSQFDFVIASHVIEHSVDLIAFLQDCDRLIKTTGRVSLVVPDKRFCFDRFKPLTSLGAVVDAHLRPTRFHTPGPLLDHQAYACVSGDQIAWWPDFVGDLRLQDPDIAQGERVIADGVAQDEYHDVHRWMFTPASFSLLIHDLRQLGFHSLVEIGSFGTVGFEFFVTLAKSDDPAPVNRLELLRRIEQELISVTSNAQGDERAGSADTRPADPRVASLEAQLAELYASTSWRLTGPLRTVSRRLRSTRWVSRRI